MPIATPDVTLVQKLVGAITAVIVAGIGVVNSFGWANITVDQSAKLLALWAALGGIAVLADAHIRHGRATVAAAVAANNPPSVLATLTKKPTRAKK
jgi:hypothetical protein